jgi:hypothetical protein
MARIGKKVAKWVDSQKEFAEEIGISSTAANSMLTGRAKFPLPRFLQTIYYLNPPQEEVTEVFNLYLEDLNLPPDSLKILHGDVANSGQSGVSISSTAKINNTINKITDAVMSSKLSAESKVEVYNIIKSIVNS